MGNPVWIGRCSVHGDCANAGGVTKTASKGTTATSRIQTRDKDEGKERCHERSHLLCAGAASTDFTPDQKTPDSVGSQLRVRVRLQATTLRRSRHVLHESTRVMLPTAARLRCQPPAASLLDDLDSGPTPSHPFAHGCLLTRTDDALQVRWTIPSAANLTNQTFRLCFAAYRSSARHASRCAQLGVLIARSFPAPPSQARLSLPRPSCPATRTPPPTSPTPLRPPLPTSRRGSPPTGRTPSTMSSPRTTSR